MLKTLEEPPDFVIIILIGKNENLFLSTIKSRCLIMHFEPLSNNEIRGFLEKNYQILLCGDNNNASDIRLSFNKEYIKSLNKFSYNNSCYEIINSILKPYTNNEFYVSIWQKKSNNIDNIKVNYTLKVNIK